MTLKLSGNTFELIDLLDRILDKGVVFDAAERVSLSGIGPINSSTRAVVTSCETVAEEETALSRNLPKPPAI